MSGFDFSVLLVGGGNMGGAMLGGWLDAGMPGTNVTVLDPKPNEAIRSALEPRGVDFVAEPPSGHDFDVMLIAVKPQVMADVLSGLRGVYGPGTVAISVAAGKTLSFMETHLGSGAHVRAMPNTPALIGKGATVACANLAVSQLQRSRVSALLAANGFFDWVEDEALIDAVTSLSGSGPAYVFHLAECMAEAGMKVGLPEELAVALARHTIAGAGAMLEQRSESAEQLRVNVTSPGGTTAAALSVLMHDDAMHKLFADAIEAARDRSRELS